MIDKLKKYLLRKRTPVFWSDYNRVAPVSDVMGTDRGTPIDRYYIDRFLYAHRNDIKGRVLEISESYYSNKFGSAVNKHEVLHAVEGNPSATIIGDLCNGESLPSGNMDCFICTQTLNYIYDVNAAVHGAWQVLRPGGVLLGSVAGISQVSSYDAERWGDFWRFTDQSIKRLLLDRFNTVEVKPFGNRLAALAFLDGIVVEDLPDQSLLDVTDTNYQLIIAFRAIR